MAETASIQRVKWALLNEWWCAPLSATEDDIVSEIMEHFQAPGATRELVKDRLFGGFKCEHEGNRHVCFSTGHYTYTGEGQSPMEPSVRAELWQKLIAENDASGNGGFIGGGPFTGDAPGKEES